MFSLVRVPSASSHHQNTDQDNQIFYREPYQNCVNVNLVFCHHLSELPSPELDTRTYLGIQHKHFHLNFFISMQDTFSRSSNLDFLLFAQIFLNIVLNISFLSDSFKPSISLKIIQQVEEITQLVKYLTHRYEKLACISSTYINDGGNGSVCNPITDKQRQADHGSSSVSESS